MKALAIAGVNLRRLFRWRTNVFFLFILPMLIILLLGAAFGGGAARLGVAGGHTPLAAKLVAQVDAQRNLRVDRFDDESSLRRAVERGRVQAGLVVPSDYDRSLRSGGRVALRYFARPASLAQQLRATVDAAVAAEGGVVRAARFLQRRRGIGFDPALRDATLVAATVPKVAVDVTDPDGGAYPEAAGRFESGASTQLLLFVILTSLTSAGALIEARRLGVSRRMVATPTAVRTVLAGEGLGRFGIALVQALIIMAGAAIAFDPLAAALLVLAFSLVGSGAGLLLGSTLANEQQSGAVSLLLGLGLAALGGSMVPLEVFPDTMRTIAHVTPHAWGNDAFSKLLRHDGRLGDIATDLGVLLGYAGALLALATWRLRRTLTAG
jgi:ABC-2 type transport system permease protein